MTTISSKERLLTVLRYQEPDHVPLLFNTFGFTPPGHRGWADQVEEARWWLSLGVDDWLVVSPPLEFHPAVRTREWTETPPGERWPVMIKEYETPAGVFRQEVYRTADWVSPDWPDHRAGNDGVRLFDDYNVARYRRPPIQSEEDLEKLKYLLHPLSDSAAAAFREHAAAVSRQAEEIGVLLVGMGPGGVDIATWLCGVEPMLMMALDQPDLFEALLDLIHAWDKRVLEVLLDTSVELVLRRGYYEGTTFWSPALYRRFIAPRLQELVALAHQAGRFLGYIMSVGVMPLLDILAEIGYDAHYLLDPLPHGQPIDLQRVKAAFAGRTAVIGGLNEPITLERGTPEQIRREVFEAVRILGPGGGLALTPAEAIMARTPWENIEVLIEAWKEVRDYPLRVG